MVRNLWAIVDPSLSSVLTLSVVLAWNIASTLQTVNIEDDEHVPHKDYVTIGLVGKDPVVWVHLQMNDSTICSMLTDH